jgi:predicted transcriptional regulator
MATKKRKKTPTDPVVAELDAVKRLIVLLLLKAGASQGEVAMALGVDQSVVSRMFPARKVKKFSEQE